METVRIQNGQTERIEVLALNSGGSPAMDLTDVSLAIRRISDGKWLDFADNTFKAAGWTTRQTAMAEVSASLDAGKYYYSFNTAGFDDDDYELRAECAGAANFPQTGELKVGGYVNNLDAKLSVIQALCGRNSRMFNTQYDSDHNLLSATIRGYVSKADLEADINPIVELTVSAAYSGQGQADTHVMKDSS